MKILLIGTESDHDIFTVKLNDIPYIRVMMKGRRSASFAPHALVTVAALTPDEHEVEVYDEQVKGPAEPRIDQGGFDLVGINMITNRYHRVLDVAAYCKKKYPDVPLVVGGPGTTSLPAELQEVVDTIFYGETEHTWPTYLKELENGRPKRLYEQRQKPDVSATPPPRWDLIKDDIRCYGAASVQTTRGCPYDCEFCDVVYLYGRLPRSKSHEQVLQEIKTLVEMGVRMILIADDNFSSNKKYAKKLLREVVAYTSTLPSPVNFFTQADVTLAQDDELLELMAEAGFIEVLIGIESIDPKALADMNKKQNLKTDITEAVRKIQSYGIAVLGSMIAGADTDDTSVFALYEKFLKDASLVDHALHPMMAPPGTKLWYRVKRQGRLVELQGASRDHMDVLTNVQPAGMSRIDLFNGLADYWERVLDPLHYMDRAIGYVRGVKYVPKQLPKARMRDLWKFRKMAFRMWRYFSFEVSPNHRKAFFSIMRETRKSAPHLMGQMVYLHTLYLHAHNHAAEAARRARNQAALEQREPERIVIAETSLPVPAAVREAGDAMLRSVFPRVCSVAGGTEEQYELSADIMMDYIARYGDGFQEFGEQEAVQLEQSCERVLDGLAPVTPIDGLPRIPPGFARNILDGLDHTLRTRVAS